jgi:hypothetical protein
MQKKYSNSRKHSNARLSAWCKELVKNEMENGSTEREAREIAEQVREHLRDEPVDNSLDRPTEDPL